eukprot:gene6284-8652_t
MFRFLIYIFFISFPKYISFNPFLSKVYKSTKFTQSNILLDIRSDYISSIITTSSYIKPRSKEWSDSSLNELIDYRKNGVKWQDISTIMNRTTASCKQKYYSLLRSKVQSLSKLPELILQYGEDWNQIAKFFNCAPDECRMGYMSFLREMLVGPWSESEDSLLKSIFIENIREAYPSYQSNKINNINNIMLKNDSNILMNSSDTIYSTTNNQNLDEKNNNIDLKSFELQSPRPIFIDFIDNSLYSNQLTINWRNISFFMNRNSEDCRHRFSFIVLGRDLTTLPDVWYEGETKYLFYLVNSRGFQWSSIGRELGRSPRQCYNCYHSRNIEFDFENNNNFDNNNNNKSILENNIIDQINDSVVERNGIRYPQLPHFRKRNKGSWNDSEDIELLRLVDLYNNQWTKIGSLMKRSNLQCFQRFQTLNRSNQVQGWTNAQNKELFQLVAKHGAQWTLISKMIGRTPYVCREAYKRLIDRTSRKSAVQTISPLSESDMSTSHPIISISVDDNNNSIGIISAIPKIKMPKRRDRLEQSVSLEYITNPLIEIPHLLPLSDYNNILEQGQNNEVIYNVTQRIWNKEDDELLRKLVNQYGRKWTIIAEFMNRSPEDVMLRFDFKITHRRTGPWSKDEDSKLVNLVNQIGPKWSKVGEIIGRSGTQCALRYKLSLDPRLKWKLWSPDEDKQLVSLRNESGYNWRMISATLDRSPPSCRYRYLKLMNGEVNQPSNNTG